MFLGVWLSFVALPSSGVRISPGKDRDIQLVEQPVCSDSSNDWRFKDPNVPPQIPPIVFVKTHKTGSTTLAFIVNRLADRRNLRVMASASQSLLGWPNRFPGNGCEEPKQQYAVISNHAVYNSVRMRSYVKQSPFFVTVLREPGAQAVSAFNYFDTKDRTWREHAARVRRLHPNQKNKFEARFINSQAHDLGWYETVGHSKAYDRDSARIHQWLESLTDFTESGMVILTEYFDEGLVLLRRRLRLNMEEVAYTVTLKGVYPKAQPTAHVLSEARKLNPVDVMLYEHFNKTFQAAWAAASRPERDSELIELRNLKAAFADSCVGETSQCSFQFTLGSTSRYIDYLRAKEELHCEERMQALPRSTKRRLSQFAGRAP